MVEVWIGPEWRRNCRCCAQERGVLFVGDLRLGQLEGMDPYAMDWAFAILAFVGAHQEIGVWDADQLGLDMRRLRHFHFSLAIQSVSPRGHTATSGFTNCAASPLSRRCCSPGRDE